MAFEYFCNLGAGLDSAIISSPVPIQVGDKILVNDKKTVEVIEILHFLNKEGEIKKTRLSLMTS